MMWNGQPVNMRNPQEARALGISMVFQHFSLFDTLTVAENVWLGLDKTPALAEVTQRITAKAGEYGLDIDPARPVHTLSVGEMQRVEIIRALLTDPKLLILDEPTSVLTPQAVRSCSWCSRSWPRRAAASSTSATSCTRSASCARLHRAARRQGHGRCATRSTSPTHRCRG